MKQPVRPRRTFYWERCLLGGHNALLRFPLCVLRASAWDQSSRERTHALHRARRLLESP
jgi:hypothetical protein